MPAIYEQYTHELRNKFGYLATWIPTTKLKLGDIGILKKDRFEYRGNLGLLADATITNSLGIDTKIIANGHLTPLFRASGLRQRLLSDTRFETRGREIPYNLYCFLMWITMTLKTDFMQQSNLWDLIQNAYIAKDNSNFAQLCNSQQELIEVQFKNWQKIPEVKDLGRSLLKWLPRLTDAKIAQGKWAEAEICLKEVLAIGRDVLQNEYEEFAILLNNSAEKFRNHEMYNEAKPLYQQAVKLKREAKQTDVALGTFLHNLAYLCLQTKSFSEAKPILEESQQIFRDQLPADDVLIGQSLNNLAGYYHAIGDISKARQVYQEALVFKNANNKSKKRHDIIVSLTNLANLEYSFGSDANIKSVVNQLEDAQPLGQNYTDEQKLNDLLKQAGAFTRLGNYEQSESMLKNAQLLEMDRLNEAEELLTECIDIRLQTIGEEHPLYLTTLNNLALNYHLKSDKKKAEQLYSTILTLRKKVLGENHPEIAQSMFNLGMLLINTERHADGMILLEEQFKIEDEDFENLNKIQEALARAIFQGPSVNDQSQHNERVGKMRADKNRLEAKLQQIYQIGLY
eukprot:gene10939-11022_t